MCVEMFLLCLLSVLSVLWCDNVLIYIMMHSSDVYGVVVFWLFVLLLLLLLLPLYLLLFLLYLLLVLLLL